MAVKEAESPHQQQSDGLHVVIAGAGMGGLTCAIACRQANPPLAVTVLESAPEILPIGAGIHIPPNATRVMSHLGLFDKLKEAGAYSLQNFVLRRWANGNVIVDKPIGNRVKKEYGEEWLTIHRGDYQIVLLEEARRSGARIVLDSQVTGVEACSNESSGQHTVLLKNGQRIGADVVIGADGLWSRMREFVLGRSMPPVETGDLAYRGTFTREQLQSFKNARVDKLIEESSMSVWLGPSAHAVFYPLRNKTEFNLVLLCADDLPEGVRTSSGSLEEMAANFEGWDPVLSMIISCLKTALKWKLLHFKELDKWTKGPVALLGDASHPTLPYQGQGAAMAVEDGAILGLLLAGLQKGGLTSTSEDKNAQLTSTFHLYEKLRKKRTETNVAGAVLTRQFYHLHDGEEQVERDRELSELPSSKWQGKCKWNWGDASYQKSLLGFDVLDDAESRFQEFSSNGSKRTINGAVL